MPSFVLPLSDPRAQDATLTGGKGSALAKMVAARLPVPDGFVVTTEAFAHSLAGLLAELEQSVSRVDESNLQALQQACAEAAEHIVLHEPDADLVEHILAAFKQLGEETVSVRSSATAEDMPDASFAGQYDSFLNVLSPHDVVDRMLHVWASLYSAHAVGYRRRQGIKDSGVRMAVIVQRQLPADAAGVFFTRDPVTGADDRYVVNATFGLGEGVVTGHMATDHFALDPVSGQVTARNVVTKEHMMASDPEGGLHTITVALDRQDEPSLSDAHLAELAGLANRVRDLFGGHQDIEFAVADGAVHLLQARPVTAVNDAPQRFPIVWEDPDDEQYGWLLQSIGQRDVKPTKRLEMDAARFYNEGARVCFEETGSVMARMHIVCYQNGYRFMRPPEVDEAEVDKRLARLRTRAEELVDRGESWWETDLKPDIDVLLAELDAFRPNRASLAELVGHMERAMRAFGHVLGDLHWRLAASREDPMGWVQMFTEATGRPAIEAGIIVQAVDNKTTRMVRWLRDLARLVQGDEMLSDIFRDRDYARLDEPAVRERPTVRHFRSRFRNLLRRYGRRNGRGFGSASDFTSPTWNIEPRLPLDLIASYALQDIDSLDEVEANARRERDEAVRNFRSELTQAPERLALFERALKHGREYVRMMENHNHLMEQATNGAMRDAIYWVGQRMVRDGQIDHPDDVIHLSLDELKAVATGAGAHDARSLVRLRQVEFEERSRLSPPPLIGKGPPPQMPGISKLMEGPSADAGHQGSIIRGTAASRGRATGPARVAPQTAAPPDVENGDILIAVNAGPNWTPIFPLIGGLVLDQGAVFQHAALVAREYKIPAVIMTKDATQTIRDGQTVTVDGDQGIVELN